MWALRKFAPIFAITLQVCYLIFLYIFYAVTFTKPVALPDKSAIWAKENDQAVTLIVTLLSTLIAYCSSQAFAGAIRYCLARFMCGPRPVSLNVVAATVTLSTGAPLIPGRRWWWTCSSILLVIVTSAQTASWTTLLTPRNIPVTAKLSGTELDVSSERFAALMESNAQLVTPQLFGNSLGFVTQSGASAVGTQFSVPTILNFNQMSYVNSTGGSLPATWNPYLSTTTSTSGSQIPASLTFTDLSADVQVRGRKRLFPISFQMTQQGFTSRVECRSVPLTATTSPSVTITTVADVTSLADSFVGAPAADLAVGAGVLTVGCTGEGYTRLNFDGSPAAGAEATNTTRGEPVLMNPARDAVLASSCGVAEVNGGAHWDIIIVGTGRYSFMNSTICSVWPLTTFVDVDYHDSLGSFNSSLPSFINNTRAWREQPSPWLGQFAVDMFLRGVVSQGQSTRGSAVGDVVRGFAGTGVPGEDLTQHADKVPKILEAYVRGVMEFSVTLLRTAYSAENSGLFQSSGTTIPEDLRIPMNGTYRTETMGWYQESSAAASTLISPTLVALLSILLIVFPMWWSSRPTWKTAIDNLGLTNQEQRAHDWFDPANLLHVISASRAGGLSDLEFPEYDDDMELWADDVGIRVGKVGESVGFVSH